MSITILKTKTGYSAWIDRAVFCGKERLEVLMKAIRYAKKKYGRIN
jgi:hypothetical protein